MIKLTYFATRGRIEPTRLLLELAGQPYEFQGVAVEDWRSHIKLQTLEHTPFGQLPLLQDGSLTICQSQAILRHVARKFDLAGTSAAEQARVDEVTETAGELMAQTVGLFWDPGFADKRTAHRELMHARLARIEGYFSRVAAQRDHWIAPDRFTLADAVMAYALETLLPLHPGLIDEFPALRSAMTAFFAADGVRQYVRSSRRPRTWTVPMAAFGGRPEDTHHWT
jgi:glutathione S-transferase